MENIPVYIEINRIKLEGNLTIPDEPRGLVIFAHGSGSSRLSPRNIMVAKILNQANLATLLFDLLTEDEDAIYENRFNIELLAERLADATRWARQDPKTKKLPIGYFGASTGAAAALMAAAKLGPMIRAVVSRGGRPDLANAELRHVLAPTLLLVGSNDMGVIELNQDALAKLNTHKELRLIQGAGHMFEEPGTLEEVTQAAADWFSKFLLPKIATTG